MQAAPGTQGPLVKLLVEGFHSPARHAFVWSSGAIKSIVTLLTRTTNPSISLALRALHVRGPGDAMPPGTQGPLVKLLVEGFHSPARHAFVWSSGAIVNLS
jgi:hypothetical protein